MNQKDKYPFAHMSVIFPIAGLMIYPPIGIILFILRGIQRSAEKRETEENKRYWDSLNEQGAQYVPPTYDARAAAERTPPRPGQQGYRPEPKASFDSAAPHPAQQGYRPDPKTRLDNANTAQAAYAPHPAPEHPTSPKPSAGVSHSGFSDDDATPEQKSAAKRQRSIALGLCIAGFIAVLAGVDNLGEFVDNIRWVGMSLYTMTEFLLPGLGQLFGGGGLLFGSYQMNATRKLEKKFDAIVGPRSSCTIEELAAATGVSRKKAMKVAQSAIEHGLFGPYAFLDRRAELLVVRHDADTMRDAPARKADTAQKPDAKNGAKPDESKYQSILRQLHAANDAIPGEEMSAKISRLETLSARIFELAEKDPSRLPQLQKFMDYYLPTSLKLLNTYAQMDKQNVQGQNISETKRSIEQSMDMLVTAFENQLDKLFQTDALDVSSDIAALQGMLNLDGLTPDNAFVPSPKNDSQT